MNTEHLQEFLELAKTESFTKAAASLHVHQSTLSKHMLALEKEFGATLFDRSQSGVFLTDQGLCFAGKAAEMLDVYRSTFGALEKVVEARAVRLAFDITDPDIAGIITLVIAINGDRAEAPPIKIVPTPPNDILDELTAGRLDIAIKTDRQEALGERGLASFTIISNPCIAVVEADHPLASRSCLSFADLKGETLIKLMSEDALPGWEIIEHLCLENGFSPKTQPKMLKSTQENLAAPLNGCVLVFPSNTRELRLLAKLKNYACIPFSEENAQFTVCCTYKPADEKRLQPFLHALNEALRIIREE